MSYQSFIKSGFAALTLKEILRSQPSVLLGVSPAIEELLGRLNVYTVFDLGLSTVFDNAARILSAGEQIDSAFRKFGRAPASMVDADGVKVPPVTALPYESIEALIGIGNRTAQELADELGADRIRDLALWPPYLAAKAIVKEAYNPNLELTGDPEMPAEL